LLLFAVADDGEFNGRILPVRLNTNHSDPEVAELGRGQLHHYLKCIGNLNPKSPEDMCGITVSITVVIRKGSFKDRNGKERDGEYNEVTRINGVFARLEQACQSQGIKTLLTKLIRVPCLCPDFSLQQIESYRALCN
jgi:hypothetical protein